MTAPAPAYGWTDEEIVVRVCRTCREPKALATEFRLARGRWRRNDCNACMAAAQRARHDAAPEAARERMRSRFRDRAARTDEQVAADRDRLRPNGRKRCHACGEWLPFGAFFEARGIADGLSVACHSCSTRKHAARRSALLVALYGAPLADLRCYICGAPAEHIEHLLPRARGGGDTLGNLHPACAACNLAKHDRDPSSWLASRLGADEAWPFVAEYLPASALVAAA